jgi:hypothetical protein
MGVVELSRAREASVAEIKLSREARRVIRRSDEPRRTHFNILLAEAALRVLRAEPELALPHKEEEMYVMGFDQAALDYARTVWAGIQRPLVRKIVFEPQELERPGAGTGGWAEAEALMGEAEKVAHRYGRTAKTSPPKEIRVAPARDRGSAAKASRTTPL